MRTAGASFPQLTRRGQCATAYDGGDRAVWDPPFLPSLPCGVAVGLHPRSTNAHGGELPCTDPSPADPIMGAHKPRIGHARVIGQRKRAAIRFAARVALRALALQGSRSMHAPIRRRRGRSRPRQARRRALQEGDAGLRTLRTIARQQCGARKRPKCLASSAHQARRALERDRKGKKTVPLLRLRSPRQQAIPMRKTCVGT